MNDNRIEIKRRTVLKHGMRMVGACALWFAVASDKAAAKTALASAEPLLMRTAQKNVIHKKAASRKVSRLAARLKAMA